MKHLSWNTPQLLKTLLIFLPNPYHLQNSIPWEKVFFPNVWLETNNQFVMTSNWERCVTNPVSFTFYSIWCHLIALLLWLTTAPSFPSSLLFCCIFPCIIFLFLVFPDVYFVLFWFNSVLVFLNQNADLMLLLSLSHLHLNCVFPAPAFYL